METYKADYSNCVTTTCWSNTGDYYTYANPIVDNGLINLASQNIINEKEKEDMMYLWEVILVNPKDDAFEIYDVTAKSETSALMEVYKISQEDIESEIFDVDFDDLKTQCTITMQWKKEKDLNKAIETIKDAVK